MWMQDDGLKEQMFLALIKMDAKSERIRMVKDKGTGELIQIHNNDEFEGSNLASNEVEFMKAYFDAKNGGKKGIDDFFAAHGKAFMRLHGLEFLNDENENIPADEEFEEVEVDGSWEEYVAEVWDEIEIIKRRRKKRIIKRPKSPLHSLRQDLNKLIRPQREREQFEELMAKKVADRLAGELDKLKESIDGFRNALGEKRIQGKIALPKKEELESKVPKEKGEQNVNKVNIAGNNSMKRGWFLSKLSQSWSSKIQFDKKLAECNEEELLAAFKHAVDVLAPIVEPFSYNNKRFLFHKKATATEARLLATLAHLFTSPPNRIIGKLDKISMAHTWERVYKNNEKESVGVKIYKEKNLQILSEYFELRSEQFGFDLKNVGRIEDEAMEFAADDGPYPFETNSMERLPQWAEKYWHEPKEIKEKPLNEETVGPDHKILTTILEKISVHFWKDLRGGYEHEVGKRETNYFVCRKGLMHIVAAYLCGLKYKDMSKNSRIEKEENCSKMHLDEFKKLDDYKQQLLEQIPMKNIIDQTIEEIVGFERNIFEAIKQGMNAQEMGKKEKSAEINEQIEDNFMLDLF